MPSFVPLALAISAAGDPLPYFDVQATLDGITFTLQFRWNTRAQAYFMTTFDETGQVLLLGDQRVVVDYAVAQWSSIKPWPGEIVFFDTSGLEVDPELGELGGRVQLLYVTAAELAAAIAGTLGP